ncbi:MAG TPA: S8 family peptidase, partial [Gemmatimonadaceae bacterium]|nr:S8 family peptidase [Gemmatimonadaceae bacterium]
MKSYIVVFKPEVRDVPARASQIVNNAGGTLRYIYTRALNGFAADLPESVVAVLRASPDVAYLSDNSRQNVLAINQSHPPNWGLDRIDQRVGPLNLSYYYERSGSGVHIYVFDTGISNHSDLAGRIGNGFDVVTPGGNADDCHGHGTHVSTIAAGSAYGVAKSSTVHSVRVVDCIGESAPSELIAGIDWTLANSPRPAIANMSLQYAPDAAIDDAVNQLIANGITVVAAAGNFAIDACGISPARAPDAITVGATEGNDVRWSSSDYGPCLDLFAPGANITAGWIGGSTATNTISGTSMATPHVAGTIAQYLEEFPSAAPAAATAKLLEAATVGAIPNPGTGSPNKLLFSWYANDTPYADFMVRD